jgi:hypothetical protein
VSITEYQVLSSGCCGKRRGAFVGENSGAHLPFRASDIVAFGWLRTFATLSSILTPSLMDTVDVERSSQVNISFTHSFSNILTVLIYRFWYCTVVYAGLLIIVLITIPTFTDVTKRRWNITFIRQAD